MRLYLARKYCLSLGSYDDAMVQAIRTIGIDPVNILRIKETCFDQLSKYNSMKACLEAAEKIFEKFDGKQTRKKVRMMK